jgi:hypothetical protein
MTRWTQLAAGLALALGLSAGAARAETPPIPEQTAPAAARTIAPPEPGLYASGDLPLTPGMTLYIFRPVAPTRSVEIGRMKVLGVVGGEVRLELLSGSSSMRSGDRLEVEATAPESWAPYAATSTASPTP